MNSIEDMEQAAVIRWADLSRGKWPELAMLYAVPNGGQRHRAIGAKLKRGGVRPGVPDLCLPVPRKGAHGLYVEMKRSRGVPSDVKPHQREWIERLNGQGYKAVVCFGADQAIETIREYLS